MKPTKARNLILFALLLIGCFIGGIYLSVYLTREPKKGDAGINHSQAAGGSEKNRFAIAAKFKEAKRLAALTQTMQRARDIGLSLNAPLEFYGRVVDQYDKPVPGVSVTLEYNYFSAVVLAAYDAHNSEEKRITDGNGEFNFSGKEGITLSVSLEPMKGIRFYRSGWSHNFSANKDSSINMSPTSKDKPFVFHAYRLGQPANVKQGFIQEFLLPDSRTYQIKLAEEKISEDGVGDLKVSVWQKGVYGERGTSWGISIESGSNFWFQQADAPFLYWAPSDGYQSSWSFSWADGEKNYSDARDFKFWVKQGDHYGSLSVECGTFFKQRFRLIVRPVMNLKAGDPNLQPVLPDWPPKDAAAGK